MYRKTGTTPFRGIADFWPNFNFAAIFKTLSVKVFHIIKSDKSKNVSGYGLNEYIDEETKVKKNYWKNGGWTSGGIAPFWPNFNFAAILWTLPDNKKW